MIVGPVADVSRHPSWNWTMDQTAEGSALRVRSRPSPGPRSPRRSAGRPASGGLERRRGLLRLLTASIGLGLAWRVARYAACPPLWGDEAFIAANLLTRDFAGLLRPLDYYQIAPVGFLWAELAAIRGLGASEWALRLPAFLAGLASLGLFAGLAGRMVDRRSALMAVAIFAASFYPVRHATEVKPYATDLFLSMATTALAWSIARRGESPGRWLAMTGVVAVGVWFSYPLIFVAGGVGLFLAGQISRRPSWRGAAWCSAFGVASVASWLVMYLGVARPQSRAAPFYTALTTWQGAFPPWSRPWRLPAWVLDVHTGNMLAYPNGGNHFASLATTILVGAGVVALIRARRPALPALLLSPLLPTLAASTFHLYPYGTSARTSLYMAPGFCLLAGVGLVGLVRRYVPGRNRPRAWRAATAAFASMIGVAAVVNVAWPYKNFEDVANRARVVELDALARPGDLWVVLDGLAEMPPPEILMTAHWIQQAAEVRSNILARASVPVRWNPKPAEVVPAPAGRTWLVVHRCGYPKFAEDQLAAHRETLGRRLGTPVYRKFPLAIPGESLEAYEFPAPGGAPSVRRIRQDHPGQRGVIGG